MLTVGFEPFLKEIAYALETLQKKHDASNGDLALVLDVLHHDYLTRITRKMPAPPPEHLITHRGFSEGHMGTPGS